MLTSDLLRYDVDDVYITPRYLKRKHAAAYLKIASDLIAIYHAHHRKSRCELDEVLSEYEFERVGYKKYYEVWLKS